MSTEQFIDAGLFDPVRDATTGRLELLQWLAGQGFSIDEMVKALRDDVLGALAGDRRLRQGSPLSNEEATVLAGVTAQQLEVLATAFGFTPPDPASPDPASPDPASPAELGLNEPEARTLAAFGALGQMFSEEESLGFARTIGAAIGRIAEAGVALFLTDVEGPSLAAKQDELSLAKNVLAAVELLDELAPMLDPTLRRHIEQAIERSRSSIMDERERLQYRYAVGFVDLVGFTPLSQEMSAADLGVFLRDFEARAHDAVTAVGARLVKLIGDEVMFVAPNPDSACLVAKTLMAEQTTADGRAVVPRGGMAYGPVLVRGGDYFGDVVTMASRLADQAAPGQLLASEEFSAASTALQFTKSEHRNLKGFAEPIQVRSLMFQ